MPIFFQHRINEHTRLGIWKIEESEDFFVHNVPLHRDVTHPHKRLQHLAGRFLLQFLFAGFPYDLIQIADTKKPFLPNEQYHFSISHCGDFAAAIVSSRYRVGIDIEIPVAKIERIRNKFLSEQEQQQLLPLFNAETKASFSDLTLLWSAKEAVFKWYGDGAVDFRQHIVLKKIDQNSEIIHADFTKKPSNLDIHYRQFQQIILAWVCE